MASFIVEGNHRLHGEITPQGAKNEALEVICATLLTTEEVVIENVPDILDVNNLIHLLSDMGVIVKQLGDNTYSFKAENIDTEFIESQDFMDKCARLRGSVMLIGPLLSRLGMPMVSELYPVMGVPAAAWPLSSRLANSWMHRAYSSSMPMAS